MVDPLPLLHCSITVKQDIIQFHFTSSLKNEILKIEFLYVSDLLAHKRLHRNHWNFCNFQNDVFVRRTIKISSIVSRQIIPKVV